MKTPRHLLLARHAAAQSKLAAVRERALASLPRDAAAVEESRSAGSRWLAALSEVFRLPRVAWGAFAAAWLVIVALNFAAGDTGAERAAAPMAHSPEVTREALQEKRRLYAELIGGQESAEATARRFVPRPRSELNQPTYV
jgi:hypothetical protein